jgi:UDP-N-acetylmuramoylalanine-D-glutamate ligase
MDWQKFAALVLSPGVPYKFPEPHRVVKMAQMIGVPVVGDMELFARAVNELPAHARPKIIGITGTNGKSTTTSLIGHILTEAGKDVRVGGNIGVGIEFRQPGKYYYSIEFSYDLIKLSKTIDYYDNLNGTVLSFSIHR